MDPCATSNRSRILFGRTMLLIGQIQIQLSIECCLTPFVWTFRMGDSNRLVWNFVDISQKSQEDSVGTLKARLELKEGPSTPALVTIQFNCEGTTLSGIEFELLGSGYRISLVKRRFVSGK